MWGAFPWGQPVWGDAPDISSQIVYEMNLCDGIALSLMRRRTNYPLMHTRTAASTMPRRTAQTHCENED